jgi:predicted 3-demethylubiquinone-9 3-methyltransferase (glyoxalase superfamily)
VTHVTQIGAGTAETSNEERQVQAITPCLTFDDRAEEAVNFYVSLFRNSRVLSMLRSDGNGPIPERKVLHASFQLDGREFTAFDGGPSFSFTEGMSLVVTCETQQELDGIWARLAEGGEEGPCGWLKDRFGVSWQVVPSALGEMMADPASGHSAKVMEALLKMQKIDIETLRHAYRSDF